ncbi:hypothetical protein N7E02_21950 [Aliirhizobium terrae]|uniref:hypothetical protein n=1 Tax=Terrirhizobium terrae TaxID=2926709 RepID=UPI002577F74B|nr:hypothetical protein [Rhizobium sp. CC-CFT758]WJH39461.1 hypothetical protein N7E02_21950 [Rhizobium sp. CC-CFT758]
MGNADGTSGSPTHLDGSTTNSINGNSGMSNQDSQDMQGDKPGTNCGTTGSMSGSSTTTSPDRMANGTSC